MPNYYLDIETNGFEPETAKIITIQYAELDGWTGRKKGELHVLREWELGEEGILRKFIEDSGVTDENYFRFVPVGYNLRFEHKFLSAKSRQYGLAEIDIASGPQMDLHVIGVLANHGSFKGSGLDNITKKPQSGREVPGWYEAGEYGRIDDYVRIEFESFVEFLEVAYEVMPQIKERLKE